MELLVVPLSLASQAGETAIPQTRCLEMIDLGLETRARVQRVHPKIRKTRVDL